MDELEDVGGGIYRGLFCVTTNKTEKYLYEIYN